MGTQIEIPEHTPERLGILTGILSGLWGVWRVFLRDWWSARRSKLVMQEKGGESIILAQDKVVEGYKQLYEKAQERIKVLEDKLEEDNANFEILRAQLMEMHKDISQLMSVARMMLVYLRTHDETMAAHFEQEIKRYGKRDLT